MPTFYIIEGTIRKVESDMSPLLQDEIVRRFIAAFDRYLDAGIAAHPVEEWQELLEARKRLEAVL